MFRKLFTLLFFIACSMAGKGAVLITDLVPDSSTVLSSSRSSWFGIDFNHDGTSDYDFSWSIGRFGGGSVYCYGPSGNEISQYGTSFAGSPLIRAIDSATLIDGTHFWANAAATPKPLIHEAGFGGTEAFVDSGTKYIGVHFKIGTASHYGWIKISFTSSYNLTIMSYGYETIASTGLPAGTPSGLPAPPAPVANFTSATTSTDTKTAVMFNDASLNTPTSWQWTFTPATVTFMSGSSATSRNPQVMFGAAGKYTVKLKATNAGGSDSVSKTDYMVVTAAPAPTANFTTTTTSTDTKTPVTFRDISGNTPTAWQWTFTPATVTFMGGTSATSQHPQVMFGAAGKYTVKLKATNTSGSDSVSKTDYMVVSAVPLPLADFTTTTTSTDTKTVVTFRDISANTPTAWQWTFTPATVTFTGGTSARSQNPMVQFNATGKYTVKLKVSNTNGSDSMTKVNYITVNIPTSITAYEAGEEMLRIYPNPARTSVTIQNPGEGIMSILDITGKTAWSTPVNHATMELDISGLPKGYYTLRVSGEQGVLNRKLIIQ